MAEMEKISEAVLNKVKIEAEQIVNQAEETALAEIEKAEKQAEIRFEDEKRKVVEEAEREAARTSAEASIKANQELSKIKAEIISRITNKVKARLESTPSNEASLLALAKEAIDGLVTDKVRLYVSPKDLSTMKGLLGKDKELASKVEDVQELDCSGGVTAEGADGKVRIDNTYDTRLEMLLPQVLPEIDKKLFEVS